MSLCSYLPLSCANEKMRERERGKDRWAKKKKMLRLDTHTLATTLICECDYSGNVYWETDHEEHIRDNQRDTQIISTRHVQTLSLSMFRRRPNNVRRVRRPLGVCFMVKREGWHCRWLPLQVCFPSISLCLYMFLSPFSSHHDHHDNYAIRRSWRGCCVEAFTLTQTKLENTCITHTSR